jgi:carboxypeptidase Taq
MTKFEHPKIKEILEYYQIVWALGHFSILGNWDSRTYMPIAGAEERGVALAKIDSLKQKILLDPEFLKLLDEAEKELVNKEIANDYERGVIRLLKRTIEILQKLPSSFVEELAIAANKAQMVWEKAKAEDDFKLFQTELEKIVELMKQQATYLSVDKNYRHPYDALLDQYEEGWITEDFQQFFDSIRRPLQELFQSIKSSSNYITTHPLEEETYDRNVMEKLNRDILLLLGADFDKLRLDVSSHPFSEALSLNDARITTRYRDRNFGESLFATIHEFGHALYDLQVDQDLKYTPLLGGISYGFHESQSRFWENIIGRSSVFLEKILPILKEYLVFLRKYEFEDFARYANLVRPSLIRVEADEVTYHFHIMLRFELEKQLIEGSLKVSELPQIWSAKMKEYIGVEPKSYATGVLQDIHWSAGLFGYFPTYSLGTFLSGMWRAQIQKEVGDIPELLKQENGITTIQQWLKDKIHKFGATYTSKEMIQKITGKDFSPAPFLDYLQEKYSKLYGF